MIFFIKTGNLLGVNGVILLAESLKTDSVLTELYLRGDRKDQNKLTLNHEKKRII